MFARLLAAIGLTNVAFQAPTNQFRGGTPPRSKKGSRDKSNLPRGNKLARLAAKGRVGKAH